MKNTLLLLVVAGCAIMVALFAVYGYERTWRLWNVPALLPSFADARVITAGAESHALGYDPLLNNPRDPWGRTMNYPRIWQLLFYLGIDQQDTIYFGVIFAVLFFAAIFLAIGNVGRRTAWVTACGIFSPAVLLGLERGNNDLLIFFLLALSVVAIKKSTVATAILIVCAFVLKLYPIFAIAVYLREPKRLLQKLLLVNLFIACAYSAIMIDELRLVRVGTPSSAVVSYGIAVAWMRLGHHFPGGTLPLQVASYATAILIAAFSGLHAGRQASFQGAQNGHIDAFRVGAAIYVGTFLIGTNWDYRLIYLLFTIPQLLSWTGSPQRWIRCIAAMTVTCTMVSLWSLIAERLLAHIPFGTLAYVRLDFVAKGTVFAGLLYLLIYSCPDWIKVSYLRMKPSAEVTHDLDLPPSSVQL